MIRMLIIGYVFAIRSERALCRDVQVNLAYRWFCGLSIEDKVPNHSTFSRARNERIRAACAPSRLHSQGTAEWRSAAGACPPPTVRESGRLLLGDAEQNLQTASKSVPSAQSTALGAH